MTEFVDQLPRGYVSLFDKESMRLSGRQRQRAAVARELLKNPDLLTLDGATSNLDLNMKETVHRGI